MFGAGSSSLVAQPAAPPPPPPQFPDAGDVSPPILGFFDLSFTYPGAAGPTFRNVSFGFDLDSRVALVGPNGAGKARAARPPSRQCNFAYILTLPPPPPTLLPAQSTLLNLMTGVLTPTTGHVSRNTRVRFATFAQHHVDGLDLAQTPLGVMQSAFPNAPAQELRNHLGSCAPAGGGQGVGGGGGTRAPLTRRDARLQSASPARWPCRPT